MTQPLKPGHGIPDATPEQLAEREAMLAAKEKELLEAKAKEEAKKAEKKDFRTEGQKSKNEKNTVKLKATAKVVKEKIAQAGKTTVEKVGDPTKAKVIEDETSKAEAKVDAVVADTENKAAGHEGKEKTLEQMTAQEIGAWYKEQQEKIKQQREKDMEELGWPDTKGFKFTDTLTLTGLKNWIEENRENSEYTTEDKNTVIDYFNKWIGINNTEKNSKDSVIDQAAAALSGQLKNKGAVAAAKLEGLTGKEKELQEKKNRVEELRDTELDNKLYEVGSYKLDLDDPTGSMFKGDAVEFFGKGPAEYYKSEIQRYEDMEKKEPLSAFDKGQYEKMKERLHEAETINAKYDAMLEKLERGEDVPELTDEMLTPFDLDDKKQEGLGIKEKAKKLIAGFTNFFKKKEKELVENTVTENGAESKEGGIMSTAGKWFKNLGGENKSKLTMALAGAGMVGSVGIAFAMGGWAAALGSGLSIAGTKLGKAYLEKQRAKAETEKNAVGRMLAKYDNLPPRTKKILGIVSMAVATGALGAAGGGIAGAIGVGKSMTFDVLTQTMGFRIARGVASGLTGEAHRKFGEKLFGGKIEDKIKAIESNTTLSDAEKKGELRNARIGFGIRDLVFRLTGSLAGGASFGAVSHEVMNYMQHVPETTVETTPEPAGSEESAVDSSIYQEHPVTTDSSSMKLDTVAAMAPADSLGGHPTIDSTSHLQTDSTTFQKLDTVSVQHPRTTDTLATNQDSSFIKHDSAFVKAPANSLGTNQDSSFIKNPTDSLSTNHDSTFVKHPVSDSLATKTDSTTLDKHLAGAGASGQQQVEAPNTTETHAVNPLAVIAKGEGVEHALRRQIEGDEAIAKSLGWDGKEDLHKFSGNAAHVLAIKEGYVDPQTGQERWVIENKGNQIAYETKIEADGSVGIHEYYDGVEKDTADFASDTFETDTDRVNGKIYEKLHGGKGSWDKLGKIGIDNGTIDTEGDNVNGSVIGTEGDSFVRTREEMEALTVDPKTGKVYGATDNSNALDALAKKNAGAGIQQPFNPYDETSKYANQAGQGVGENKYPYAASGSGFQPPISMYHETKDYANAVGQGMIQDKYFTNDTWAALHSNPGQYVQNILAGYNPQGGTTMAQYIHDNFPNREAYGDWTEYFEKEYELPHKVAKQLAKSTLTNLKDIADDGYMNQSTSKQVVKQGTKGFFKGLFGGMFSGDTTNGSQQGGWNGNTGTNYNNNVQGNGIQMGNGINGMGTGNQGNLTNPGGYDGQQTPQPRSNWFGGPGW